MKQLLSDNDLAMATRIGTRAAASVRQGATHLDAITTQLSASGVDTWDASYPAIKDKALAVLLEQVPLWKAVPRGSHTDGWTQFAAEGQPSGGTTEEEAEEEPNHAA